MAYSANDPGNPNLDTGLPGGSDAGREASLDALADHCLAAQAIIGRRGSAVMRRLIDLLLFEIGSELASRRESPRKEPAREEGILLERRRVGRAQR